ncbi:helix-turn-helix transcriptional regulator [Azospirillum sp. A26]|uniref:helix-turn-helix transcriptional regulator n=1 Tax=unclassified Azospirillum TaxID=2630922 RepID=UPI000D6058EC|nr:helix-turn-helix transcriptional regulator [Azospirillum sp. TSA6c]PWC54253.1 hypothetical protein TSA6c_00580 [Azospirillum sp. TSA6c]
MTEPNKLKELRKQRKLSEDRLAEIVGTGRSTIVKLQNGTLPITVEWAEKLASALGCKPWDMLRDDKSEAEEALELMLRWRAAGKDGKASVLNVMRLIPPEKPDPAE